MRGKFDTLVLHGCFGKDTPVLSERPSPWGKFTDYYYRKSYGMPLVPQWFWGFDVLDAHYKQRDPSLMRVYDEIKELTKSHKILLNSVGDMMHPDFVKKHSMRYKGMMHDKYVITPSGDEKPIYTIYSVDGEPASSKLLSHPVVDAFDFATTCGTMQNEEQTNIDALLEHGAFGASRVDCGTKYHKNHIAWNSPIDKGRDIDVVFVGVGDNINFDIRHPYPSNKYVPMRYLASKGVNVHCEKWTGVDQTEEIYRRSKISVNLHGPSPLGVGSAQRLWDLAVCGVMVVSDGKEFGLDDIFKITEPGKQCAAFSYKDLDEMVAAVKYYLGHEEERIAIAERARERTRREYRNDADDNYHIRIINKAIEFWKEKGMWE